MVLVGFSDVCTAFVVTFTHQKIEQQGNDGGASVDNHLPSVREAEERPRVQQSRDLGLDGLRQKRPRANNLGRRIGKSSWLGQLERINLGHGVSLLRWVLALVVENWNTLSL